MEANQHRALASYAMMRLQRNRGVRWARCCLKKGMHVLHVVGLYVHIYRDHECVQCGRSPAKGEEMQQIKAIITFRLKD